MTNRWKNEYNIYNEGCGREKKFINIKGEKYVNKKVWNKKDDRYEKRITKKIGEKYNKRKVTISYKKEWLRQLIMLLMYIN